ncbi:MAG TPA: hypothetical protein VM165_26200 [Planctomycetaceae bacterium]|nr:hypothetical protein [Planctomycetaceae bacterium]
MRGFSLVITAISFLTTVLDVAAADRPQPASSATEQRFRLLGVRAGGDGLSLQSGSTVLEPSGAFASQLAGRREVGGWSGEAGLISTLKTQPLGTGSNFSGVTVGPLLVGVHSHNSQILPAGVTVGVAEQRTARRGNQFSFVSSTDSPPRTLWVPPINRNGELRNATTPSNNSFYALHGGVRGSNEVSLAYPPVFQPLWTAESKFYVPEGPSFDRQGNCYFTPAEPADDPVMLVSVDGQTGARRFSILGAEPGQGGAPLILNAGGGQAVYTGGAERIIAVSAESGALLWEQTELPAVLSSGNGADDEIRRLMGINYHAATDALIAAYTNGFLVALNRETSEILGSLDLPGDPAIPSNFDEEFIETYGDEIEAELAAFDLKSRGVEAFASILLGGDVVIANYFSVDPNSSRLWVGGTLEDEADGTPDGQSELGALYGIDVTGDGAVNFSIATQVNFPKNSASTVSIRPDGERIYIADGESQVLAIDRQGHRLWTIDVGGQVFGSLGVSSFGEIFASTQFGVTKIREVGQSAEIEWQTSLNGIYKGMPDGWEVRNLNIVGIGANGIVVQTSIGPLSDFGTGLPVRMALTLYDRGTGVAVNSTQAVEETVAVMSSGPDGAVVLANSPTRRIILRVVTSGSPGQRVRAPPLVGGLTKYGTASGFDLLARDASFAALSMLTNAEQTFAAGDPLGGESGVVDTQELIGQTDAALQKALLTRELPPETVSDARLRLGVALSKLEGGNLPSAIDQLQTVSDLLNASATAPRP